MKRIFFIAYLLLLIMLTDFIYKVFFEKLPPLQSTAYLQLYGDSIHQRSNIEGLFYELKPNSNLVSNTASSFKIKDAEVNKSLVSFRNMFNMSQDVVINSFGMRDKKIKLKKDNFRILVLGDSVTFAFEVSQDERFTEVAEKILNKNVRKCEILNAGVCAYNTIQEFIALKEKYLKLKPDLVIFAYCMNDLEESKIQFLPNEYPQKFILNHGKKLQGFSYPNISDREYLSLVLPNQFFLAENFNRQLMLNSSIYRFLSIKRFKRIRNIKRDDDLQYYLTGFDINDTLQNIGKLASANNNGIPVRFLILPAPSIIQWNKEDVVGYFEKNNIIFWDFDAMVKKKIQKNANLWVGPEAVHLNSHGHYIVGKLLAREIDRLIKR